MVRYVRNAIIRPLIAGISQNPLEAAEKGQEEWSKIADGYRAEKYAMLGLILGVAQQLKADKKAWRHFVRHSFWVGRHKKPKKGDQSDALRHVAVFITNAKNTARYNRAFKYARALECYVTEGVDPADVPDRLKADGGIEALYERATALRPRRSAAAPKSGSGAKRSGDEDRRSPDWGGDDREDEDADGWDDPSEDSDDAEGEPERKPQKPKAGRKPASLSQVATLNLEIDPSDLEDVLDTEEGQKVRVTIEQVGTDGKWVLFRVVNLKRLRTSD